MNVLDTYVMPYQQMICLAFWLLQRPCFSHSITLRPTGAGTVDPEICKSPGQVVHHLNRNIFGLGRSAGKEVIN